MELRFTALARTELREAKHYYSLLQAGLGERFQHEAETAAKRILAHPSAWPVEQAPVRKFLFNRFPCKMLYTIEPTHVAVLAVAHQHRHPDHWVERLAP